MPHTHGLVSELDNAVVLWSDWLVSVIMVSVYLPSDALSQHLLPYLGFSYLGCGVSLHGCSLPWMRGIFSWMRGIYPSWPWTWSSSSRPSLPAQQLLLGVGVAPLGYNPWPPGSGSSSWPPPLTLDVGKLLLAAAPALSQPGALGHYPWPWARGSSSWPRCCAIHRSRRASVRSIAASVLEGTNSATP